MLKDTPPPNLETLEKVTQAWKDWQLKMTGDPSMVYDEGNILSIDLVHYHTTPVPYFQGDMHHMHYRINLDDELAFVDLLFGTEDDQIKYLLIYVDTEFMTIIPTHEEN